MALNLPGLVSDLAGSLDTNITAQVSALKRCQGIAKFWSTGLGPGGSTPLGTPTAVTMKPDIEASFLSRPEAALAVVKEARAIDAAFKSIVLAGGVYGVHVSMVTPGPVTLGADLLSSRNGRPASAALAAVQEAQKIMNYTIQGIASGSGIPPSVPPQLGSIS